jgi:hypothetical protein
MTTGTQQRSSRRAYVAVVGAHFLLVLVGPVYYLIATVGTRPIEANIGAGLAILWTAAWGLPWSLWPWFARLPGTDTTEASYAAYALLNVLLVALFLRWRWRRSQAAQ